MAAAAGVRAASCAMLVPRRMCRVSEAAKARGVKASDPQASAVKTLSKPSRSASWAVSTKSVGGCACQ